MKLAVMQPYLFPYIGYYQLVNASDKFIIYDDVNYIKKGYINRNNILVSGKSQRFTLPVLGMSQNKLISELSFDSNVRKILKTIEHSYLKAPFFEEVYELIKRVLLDTERSISNIAGNSIKFVFDYLDLSKDYYYSSLIKNDKTLDARDRLIELSKILQCHTYINSPGGRQLYSKEYFAKENVKLKFLETLPYSYIQSNYQFVPHLSIIDVLMWNDKNDVYKLLNNYRLL